MPAKIYTKEYLVTKVAEADSVADVITRMGKKVSGGLHNHVTRLIKIYEIDTSHFTYRKKNAGMNSLHRKRPEEILILIQDPLAARAKGVQLTRALIESGIPYECKECGTTEWQGKPLTLDVDHIDGNPLDCRIENVRFLCPNCHRQTPTFGNPKASTNEELEIMRTCSCGGRKQIRAKVCSVCYATKRKEKTLKIEAPVICLDCPKEITGNSTRCRDCYHTSTQGKLKPASTNKIAWPAEEELLTRLRASNFFALGRELGVSDNAIRKRVRMLGYDPKTLVKGDSNVLPRV